MQMQVGAEQEETKRGSRRLPGVVSRRVLLVAAMLLS